MVRDKCLINAWGSLTEGGPLTDRRHRAARYHHGPHAGLRRGRSVRDRCQHECERQTGLHVPRRGRVCWRGQPRRPPAREHGHGERPHDHLRGTQRRWPFRLPDRNDRTEDARNGRLLAKGAEFRVAASLCRCSRPLEARNDAANNYSHPARSLRLRFWVAKNVKSEWTGGTELRL